MPIVVPTQPKYINRFYVGLYTQRSPLVAPLAIVGLHIVEREDALIAGSNAELSNRNTLIRRAGHSRFVTVALGSSEIPRMFYSDRSSAGALNVFHDLTTTVKYSPSGGGSTLTLLFNQSAGAGQCFFQRVGAALYIANGKDFNLWNDSDGGVYPCGIPAPVTAPTLSFAAGSISATSGWVYYYSYANSKTGHEGPLSPASANTGPLTNQNVTVGGGGSTQTGDDKVHIYRTKDGGSTPFFLTEIANATPTWTYVDSTPDSGLNTEIIGDLYMINSPPPTGITNLAFFAGCMWGSVDNIVYYSAGAQSTVGVPEQAWPPANFFKFPTAVTKLMLSPFGLLVFTADDVWSIQGVDSSTFYPQIWFAGLGLLNPNAATTDGQTVYLYTSQGQALAISSNGREEFGFPVGDTLVGTFNPATAYISVHHAGSQDSAVYLSDGSANIARYSLTHKGWSSLCPIVGGCGAIRSVETSPGVHTLLVGRPTGGGYILKRDLTVWTDDGATYPWSATIGGLLLSPPGTLASVESVITETNSAGSQPSVAILPNDTSGTYIALPTAVSEPPELAAASDTVAQRYYLKYAAVPELMRYVMLQLTWPSENAGNELRGVTVMPTPMPQSNANS